MSGEHIAEVDTGESGMPPVRISLYREHLRAINMAGYNMAAKHISINVRLKWHGGGKLRIDGAYDKDDNLIEISVPTPRARNRDGVFQSKYKANTRGAAAAGSGRRLR